MSPTCLPSHQLFHIPSPSPSATPQPCSSSHYTLFPQYTRFPPPRILCQSFRSQLKCGTCLAKTSQSNKAPAPCARPVLFHTLFSCPFLLFPNLQCCGLFAALSGGVPPAAAVRAPLPGQTLCVAGRTMARRAALALLLFGLLGTQVPTRGE